MRDTPIYILCPDLNIPSGGIKRLYRIAGILFNEGFNACILHEKTGFHQDWVHGVVPVRYADQIRLQPSDIVVIPETLPDIMKQIPSFCRKVVHAFSWTYIFQNMKVGETWRDYDIEMVLTPSGVIADFIRWSMDMPVYQFRTGIDHAMFYYQREEKLNRISFLAHRSPEGEWVRKIFSQLPRDLPDFQWIAISNKSEEEYANIIRQSRVFLATGIREGVPGPVLEAMACGCVVIGYRGVGGDEYLTNGGENKNFFGVENGDYFSLSRSLETVLRLIDKNDPIIEKVIQNGIATTADLTFDGEARSIIEFWKDFVDKERNGKSIRISENQSSISLCMIVKNEEKLLAGCLESVKSLVDEIIIVDTGSTDRSVEIGQEHDAKIFRHPWENDFARHRNQSISYATGEWILILDADEVFVHSGAELLRKAIEDDDIDSIAVQVINPVNSGKEVSIFNSIRVFRNSGKIRYEGTVHNQLIGQEKTKFYPVQIYHHGYNLDESKMRAKFERTSMLLKEQIANEPDNPLPHHYLAVSYMNMGHIDPAYYRYAIDEGTQAIRLSSGQSNIDQAYIGSHYVVAATYFNLGNIPEAEKRCIAALDFFKDHLDSYYLLVKIYDKKGDFRRAKHCAERYIALREEITNHPERFGTIINQNFSNLWLIMVILGKAQYHEGERQGASKTFMDVSNNNIANWDAQVMIGRFYFENSQFQSATYFLKRANEIKKEKLILYMLCDCHGHTGDTDNQITVLSEIIQLFPEERDNLKIIGMNQIEKSNYRVASFCLSTVYEMGDQTPEVIKYLHMANQTANPNANAVISMKNNAPIRPHGWIST